MGALRLEHLLWEIIFEKSVNHIRVVAQNCRDNLSLDIMHLYV